MEGTLNGVAFLIVEMLFSCYYKKEWERLFLVKDDIVIDFVIPNF